MTFLQPNKCIAELADLQADQQREMEGLLDNVRQLTRDLRLQMLVIDAFIPPEYQVNFPNTPFVLLDNK